MVAAAKQHQTSSTSPLTELFLSRHKSPSPLVTDTSIKKKINKVNEPHNNYTRNLDHLMGDKTLCSSIITISFSLPYFSQALATAGGKGPAVYVRPRARHSHPPTHLHFSLRYQNRYKVRNCNTLYTIVRGIILLNSL